MIGIVELIYYEGDISVVEAEEFSYTIEVEKIDPDGIPYTEVQTVTSFQTFTPVPEMVEGVYLTRYVYENQATAVQDFMETLYPSTTLIGNWDNAGEYFKQWGASDFDPTAYENFLNGATVASSIIASPPQVMNYSGWGLRDLQSNLVFNWSFVSTTPIKDLVKNTWVNILLTDYQSETATTLIDPQFQYRIELYNGKNKTNDIDVRIKKNGVIVRSLDSFTVLMESNYTIDVVDFLTGVNIDPNDYIEIEMYTEEELVSISKIEWYAKYTV